MTSLSNYLENKLLDHVYGGTAYTPPSTLYLDFFSASPDFEAGTGGTSVLASRIAIANNTTNFPAATSGAKTNGTVFASDVNSSGSSWSIVSCGIYDASTSGNLLIGKTFASTLTVAVGELIRFPVGQMSITFSGASSSSGFSNYLSSKLCDLVFGNVSYTAPSSIYYAAFTTSPNMLTGSGGVEASGGSYARASLTNNTTNYPNASAGAKSNAVATAFVTPTADWGTILSIGAYDALSSGNFLGGSTLAVSKSASTGTPVSIEIGDHDITLN